MIIFDGIQLIALAIFCAAALFIFFLWVIERYFQHTKFAKWLLKLLNGK